MAHDDDIAGGGRAGRDDRRMAVVDPNLRVRYTQRLRVIDCAVQVRTAA